MHIDEVLHHFNGKKSRLAAALGITRQAIEYWKKEEIPKVHELRLRYEILPEVFGNERPTSNHSEVDI